MAIARFATIRRAEPHDRVRAVSEPSGDLGRRAPGAGPSDHGRHGNSDPAHASCWPQAKQGVVCVRSTRVARGLVGRNVELDDDVLGFLASMGLNPRKSSVLLRLALLKTEDLKEIQRYFIQY